MSLMRTLSSKFPGGRRGITAAVAGLLLGIVIAAGWSVGTMRHRKQPHQQPPELPKTKPSAAFNLCMAEAEELVKAYRDDDAMKCLGLAIDNAPDVESKALAGLQMGWLLLGKAQGRREPHALAAHQYLSAVVELTQDEEKLKKAYMGLVKSSRLIGNVQSAYDAIRGAILLAKDPADEAEWRLQYLEVCAELGSWPEMNRFLKELEPSLASVKGGVPYQVMQFTARERLLQNPAWFDEYQRQHSEEPRDKLRTVLLNEAVELSEKIVKRASPEIRDDCYYRLAMLCYGESQYGMSTDYIQKFLDGEPSVRKPDALLLLTRLSVARGDLDAALKIITVYLKRFGFSESAEYDVAAVIDALEKRNRLEDAYRFTRDVLGIPVRWNQWPHFYVKAACLANKLGLKEDAAQYHAMLVESSPGEKILSEAASTLAAISLERNDLLGADKWLVEYLTQHMDSAQTEKLYDLLDIRIKLNAPLSEILLVGKLAADANPSSPKALAAKMAVAHRMEEVGLSATAEDKYNGTAMLGYMAAEQNLTGTVMTAITDATLGKARCLLAKGDTLKADHLLREVCRLSPRGPIRSEAAYWWATIARGMGQCKEALRRLGLVDPSTIPAELAAGVEFEKSMVDLTAGRKPAVSIKDLFDRLTAAVPKEHSDVVRRAYTSYFDELEKQESAEDMQALLAHAVQSPYTNEIPLKSFALRLADVVLKQKDLPAFVECLSQYEALIRAGGNADVLDSARALLSVSTQLEQIKPSILKHMDGKNSGG
jgi:tetratricopeptide (TPR) repeat protein